MLTEHDALVEQVFARLCAKYVQRQDDRQKSMGLQYTTAETHDLAEFIAAIRTTDAARIAELEAALRQIETVGEWASTNWMRSLARATLRSNPDDPR